MMKQLTFLLILICFACNKPVRKDYTCSKENIYSVPGAEPVINICPYPLFIPDATESEILNFENTHKSDSSWIVQYFYITRHSQYVCHSLTCPKY
jgi:hypothetical protein